jgi:hypothetical protein
MLQTLKDAGIEFELASDSADANFSLIQAAFFANTNIEVLALDGAVGTAGSQGLRMTTIISAFNRSEPLEETVTISVTVKPTPNDDATPAWYTAV